MDDTQQSRVSDAAAAATRKRRSSILKSQRPARTPFSELEFNVATPTDSAKSRRVSFSRRTGVAEFVTNEATTTWKNFYEEHNKSLESSSNDSEANASRQPVGHLGKRIFDQQFEEVEAVDFLSGLANGSLNNINFSQQLASLECTGDGKLTAPHNKFELSAFTEQSKLFGNDFVTPSIGENSGRIDVNFSAIQQIEKDDLDEIEKDFGRGSNNLGCHGPFRDEQNMSEYLEVDLNMTHVVKNDEDMSITDTVRSPVQEVSKSASIDKKVSLNHDWAADKENIVVNPYAAPSESHFAVNEEPDQVLVFDGKRLTSQPDIPEKDKNYRQTLLPDSSAETPQRKTIVLNVNDDLPNFAYDMLNSKCENSSFNDFQDMKANDDEISDTVPDIKPKRNTIHDNTGNISMTQALPTNIICQTAIIGQDANASKRRTIVFNESTSNMSVTNTVPVKPLTNSGTIPEHHRTLVYEDDKGNISITQAVPSNILVNEDLGTTNKPKTIVFDSDEDNVSITQAVSSNILDEQSKRKTIIFDADVGNVSYTEALPANIMLPHKQTQEKRRTIIYENDAGDISVTQAIPTNVILPNNERNPERRQTVIYVDDTGNISVTQALPTNILQERVQLDSNKENTEVDKIPTQYLPNNITAKDSDASRRRTIVFENDAGNISITQAIPSQLIPGYSENKPFDAFNTSIKPRNRKRTTIVYDNDEGNISMTEAIPANIIEETTNESKPIDYDEDEAKIATTLAISANVFLLDKLDSAVDCIKETEEIKPKEEGIDYKDEHDSQNPTGAALQDDQKSIAINADDCNSDLAIQKSLREREKRKTVIFDNDNCDISMTKPIPAEIVTFGTELLNKSKTMIVDATEPDQLANSQSDVIVLQVSTPNSKPSLHSNTNEHGDLNYTMDIYRNKTSDSKEASSANITVDGTPSPVEDVSANASLLHSRIEQKTDQINLMSSSSETNEDKVSEGEDDALIQTDSDVKPSVLPSPLTMSATSVDSGTEDKSFMARIESNLSSDNLKQDTSGNSSNESMFYIRKDSDYATQIDREEDNEGKSAKPSELTYNHSPILKLEDKEGESVQIDDLKTKLKESKTAVSEKSDISNITSEDVDSSDLEDVVEKDKNVNVKEGHYFNANDTQQLLELISNLTANDDDVEPVKLIAHKDVTEHKRLGVATKRQSIALSREDLLSNISMAQAALQKSRLALDDSDCLDDDTRDLSVDVSKIFKKSGRTSNEVVKTLQFDDESISETSLKLDKKCSLLKKTVFGETSYMNEGKGKVIPTYLKDVSEGMKELMLDLTKPMNDNLPFESVVDKGLTKVPSTQSTQIQANLFTSSQIDVSCELSCEADTNTDAERGSSLTSSLNRSRPRSLRSPVKFSGVSSAISSELYAPDPKAHSPSHSPVESAPPEVLIFDHLNPLNNILLAPIDHSSVHKYNPKKSDNALYGDERSHSTEIHLNKSRDNNIAVEAATTEQFRTARRTTAMQEDVQVYKQPDDQFSLQSTSSGKPVSIDQSIGGFSTQLRDDQVNTVIAMRGNKELLEGSSSLTLVDDSLDGDGLLSPDNEYDHHRIKFSRSNLVDIEEQALENDNINKAPKSGWSERINNSVNWLANKSKGRKRTYSPTDKYRKYQPKMEVTPKAITKMQKFSSSPNPNKVTIVSKVLNKDIELPSTVKSKHIEVPSTARSKDIGVPSTAESPHKMAPEKELSESSERSNEQSAHSSTVDEKESPKAKETQQGQTITVQQLLTDFHNLDCDFVISEKHLLEDLNINPKTGSLTALSQSDASFTSSKNLNAMKDVNSESITDYQSSHQSSATMKGFPLQMDLQSDTQCTISSNRSGSDSGGNVVAKIDMLPFMGSHECEWESSSSDTWSFRLLHGRLRLTARLAHRHDNGARTQVRGETPVLDIALETVQLDRKNPVATMTVRFACETMRCIVSRALRVTCHASDIPPLLRRCAATARVALRWGRAMHDAKLHLAYTLDNDGNLSLKVANIPLRSVWEVTMRIELALDDNCGVPWPSARGVRVDSVVSDVLVPDADVQRALASTPRDWGHVPRTIWRIFRYLKYKTRDDDLLLA